MADLMQFPETFEEFAAIYGFPDGEEVYTNGARLIPLFRVEQWLEHIDPVKHGKWLPHPTEPDWDVCSVCGIGTHRRFHYNDIIYGQYDVEESFMYCPHCGALLDGGKNE